jgi:predicted ATPase/class 3 adenylate cyclase
MPIGCVTFLFADIEASSQGWQAYGDEFLKATNRFYQIGQDVRTRHGGEFVNDTGDGFLIAFASPMAAVLCAADLQTALLGNSWDALLPALHVRIGLHTDEPLLRGSQYTGLAVWNAHRVMDAARGTQIILSETTHALVKDRLGDWQSLTCKDLGLHRLRDLLRPVRLFRLEVAGLPQSRLSPRVLRDGKHNLPEEDRPFIGRVDDVEAIRSLISSGSRLVTLTGIGGIGKTRLAKQVAANLSDDYHDGIWLVSLDGLTGREELVAALAVVLEAPGELSESSVLAAFESRHMLLILDCFERLVDCADIVDALLRRAPRVFCLVTSRHVLALHREREYPVSPMPVTRNGLETLPDGVALFAEAATYVCHDFMVSAENLDTVCQLCDVLEGIPLSLILAASRLRHLTVEELLDEVRRNRFELLVSRSKDTSRHAALEEVIASSIRLLPDNLRSLLLHLSVFSGGFYIQDANIICAGSVAVSISASVLDGIAALREHSLVHVHKEAGRSRYRLLDTVRDYLLQACKNASADYDGCQSRHAQHYADLAERMAGELRQGSWKDAKDVLWREIGNIRAAIRYALDGDLVSLTCRLANSLALFFQEVGLWSELEALAVAGADAMERSGEQRMLARLLGIHGALLRRRGNEEEAQRLWERRLTVCEQIGDPAACADTLIDLSRQAIAQGDPQKAVQRATEALELARGAGRTDLVASALTVQAEVAQQKGDVPTAKALCEQAWEMLRSAEADKGELVVVGLTLGNIYYADGNIDAAQNVLEEVASIAIEIGHTFVLGHALLYLGMVYARQGNRERVAPALVASCKIHNQLNSRLKGRAEETLAEFRNTCFDPAILALLHRLSRQAWRTIVATMFRKPKEGET